MSTPQTTWTHPKNSTIKIRLIENTTTQDGQRVVCGESFLVVVPARTTGRGRLRRQFDTKKDAEDFAAEQWQGTQGLGQAFFQLSPEQRRQAVAALDLLPVGASILDAVSQYADAHRKLGGRPLREAVDYFIRRNPLGMPVKTVDEVFTEMLEAKRKDGASAPYLRDLQIRAGKFALSFPGQIADVTAPEISKWLRDLKCGGRSRNNYRRCVGALFSFAKANDYITTDHLDLAKVPKAKESSFDIEIFTPEQMSLLLTAAQLDPDSIKDGVNKRYIEGYGLLPLLLFSGFAGLRSAEVARQRWEDVNLQRNFVKVSAAKGNVSAKRIVTIQPNLRQWLALIHRDRGPVLDVARLPDALDRLSQRSGVKWRHNGLRHSFISYQVALTKNVPAVALECGNSSSMIFRHYREVVTPDEARAWFSISPSDNVKNVVAFKRPAVA